MSAGLRTVPVAVSPPRRPPHPSRALAAVVRRALLDQRRAVLAWGGSLGALCAFMAAIYPSIRDTIDKVSEGYPSGLKEAFGVEQIDTVEGYVHTEMFSLIVPLAIGWLAIRAVARATAGAEESGYLDTVLALPLSRRVLAAGSYVATAFVVLAVLAITGALTFVAGRIAGTHISLGLTAAGAVGVWPLAMFFAGVAMVGAGLLHRSGAVSAVAAGTLVGMYAIDLAGRLAEPLEPIRWASAFKYYGAPLRDGVDVVAFLALAGAGVVLAVAGALLFERRDILH